MSREDQTILPSGFAGRLRGWHELTAAEGPILRLPDDAIDDGAYLRLPDGQYSCIQVRGFLERYGHPERFIESLCRRLQDGGELLLDVANLQSPEALRVVLSGNTGQNDPAGAINEPERALLRARLIAAAMSAGLHIDDLYALPSGAKLPSGLAAALISQGLMALSYMGRKPAERFWLRGRKRASIPGSVLIGPGPQAHIEATEACLRGVLPPSWEIRTCEGSREELAFNREIGASAGRVLLLLRAGSRMGAEHFHSLLNAVLVGPAMHAPVAGEEAVADPSGLMMTREQVLRLGPIAENWCSAALAYEDWFLRMNAELLRPQRISGEFSGPALTLEPGVEAARLDAETEELIATWQAESMRNDLAETSSEDLDAPPWQDREPRISLCMITRDEEDFLPACLERVAGCVDEIVIVDTGSTDRTVEIAESFGAMVIHREWDDDFSSPRNAGIEAATGDWILVLDADELVDVNSIEELRRLVRDPAVSGYHLTIENQFEAGKSQGVLLIRLFRRLPGVRYCNRMHEQVAPSLLEVGGQQGLRLALSTIKILHLGYAEEVVDSRQKNERNERLFKLQLQDDPEDPYSLYKYGDFLRRIPGRANESVAVLEKTFELIVDRSPGCPRGLPFASEVAALCALEHAKAGDYERAQRILDIALQRFVPTPNLHYVAAGIALRRDEPDQAIQHYRRCLQFHDQVLVVPIQDGVTSYVSLTGIAMALLHKGDVHGAKRMLEQSYALNQDHEVTSLALSRVALEEGNPHRALQYLTDHLSKNPEAAGACQQATMILASMGEAEKARELGERAVVLLERNASSKEARRMKESLAALC
ncbi:MAG: tetratricopeptide repeat-containing glycosyltransferase family 2 protein [Planctomycetota bacterium]